MPAEAGEPVVVLGRGRAGRSLAAALRAAGQPVELRPGRDGVGAAGPTGVTLAVLAVPDGAVAQVAAGLAAAGLPAETAAVHMSGALGLDALGPLAAAGHAVGSFHPLQPFPVERPPAAFQGALVGIDASEPALLERLRALALLLGARPRRVRDAERVAYHAAAAMAANLLVALADQSAAVLRRTGWTGEDALDAVTSLMRGSLDALQSAGLPAALSGPVRRGDWSTVAGHVAALEPLRDPTTRARPAAIYRELSLAAIDLAVRCGLGPDEAARVETALTAPAATSQRRQPE
jgi:predicted short-subunit dehydrogenase-like oxidoreductase (DUF2520 family)